MKLGKKLVIVALSAIMITPIAPAINSQSESTTAEAKTVKTIPARFRGTWKHYRGNKPYKRIIFDKHSLWYRYSFGKYGLTGGKLGTDAAVSVHGQKISFGFGNAASEYNGKLITKRIHGKKRAVLTFSQPKHGYASHGIHSQYIR